MKKSIQILLTSAFAFFAMAVSAQTFTINNGTTGSQTFNGNGTVVVSAGVTATVNIQIWGAGGGGSTQESGGGGGGGGYTSVTSATLTAGTYNVVVGQGGTAGNPGGESSFNGSTAGGGGSTTGDAAGTGGSGTIAGSAGGVGTGAGNGSGAGGGGSCSSSAPPAGGNAVNGNNKAGGAGGAGCDGTGGTGGTSSGGGIINGGDGTGIGGGGGAGNDQATSTGGTGANGRVVVTIVSTVPVSYTFFTAEEGILNWQTASELNNDRFEIERQLQSETTFSRIGMVKGMGTSNQLNDYTYTDKTVLPSGSHCYRLKQIDFDGVYEYSNVACVSVDEQNIKFQVYPNPFASELTLAFFGEVHYGEVQLLTSYGELVGTYSVDGENSLVISTADLLAGIYFVIYGEQAIRVIRKYASHNT